jgi:hypothetical protein
MGTVMEGPRLTASVSVCNRWRQHSSIRIPLSTVVAAKAQCRVIPQRLGGPTAAIAAAGALVRGVYPGGRDGGMLGIVTAAFRPSAVSRELRASATLAKAGVVLAMVTLSKVAATPAAPPGGPPPRTAKTGSAEVKFHV